MTSVSPVRQMPATQASKRSGVLVPFQHIARRCALGQDGPRVAYLHHLPWSSKRPHWRRCGPPTRHPDRLMTSQRSADASRKPGARREGQALDLSRV